MAQHRNRQGKRVSTHHSMEGVEKLLKIIATWPEVTTVIPGPWRNIRTRSRPLTIRVQLQINTGLKCVASRTGRRQELTIVTKAPDRVAERIRAESWGI